jgi:hypothetical protein
MGSTQRLAIHDIRAKGSEEDRNPQPVQKITAEAILGESMLVPDEIGFPKWAKTAVEVARQ